MEIEEIDNIAPRDAARRIADRSTKDQAIYSR
jgi:hypothetical protein